MRGGPFEGGKQAVAEAWRNLTAVGATPIAVTDNLNFGNPEKPEIMGQFVGCVKGIGAACEALDFPVVSGNVSLYNETNGQGILPPHIGGVGLIDDVEQSMTLAFKAAGEAIFVVGKTDGWLGSSAYLYTSATARTALRRRWIWWPRSATVTSCAASSRTTSSPPPMTSPTAACSSPSPRWHGGPHRRVGGWRARGMPAHAFWFGEDQARYVVTLRPIRPPRWCAGRKRRACP